MTIGPDLKPEHLHFHLANGLMLGSYTDDGHPYAVWAKIDSNEAFTRGRIFQCLLTEHRARRGLPVSRSSEGL